MGGWMTTLKGQRFYPLDPRAEEIDIDEIAHALSMQCRFNGHCEKFYSIAEHSVIGSRAARSTIDWDNSPYMTLWNFMTDEERRLFFLYCLLHDSAEAFFSDVVRPLKVMLPQYKEEEQKLEQFILFVFGINRKFIAKYGDMLKFVDTVMLHNELHSNVVWNESLNTKWGDEVLDEMEIPVLRYWTPEQAKAEFISEFRRLIV